MSRSLPITLAFENVSIIIAAINETISLRKTVEILYETCALSDIKEIILVVAKKSTPDCLKMGEELRQNAKVPFHVLVQTKPFAGGAYQDAFELAQGSHVVMMASDLETNPGDVHKMIAEAKLYPNAVICTSRWCHGAVFGKGYSRTKYVFNYIFQQIMKVVYGTGLTDWTFGFRLFPRSIVMSIRWEEMRHPFFLETVLKPLSLGFQTREIATSWSPREEGVSQNPFWRNFLYFKTVVKVRFASKETLWRDPSGAS
jgi:glycosyltransferase involved in cell wall biosynthesis